MSIIDVTNVKLEKSQPFANDLKLKVTFTCHAPGLGDDASIDWKVVMVSADAQGTREEELLEAEVGPVKIGKNQFVLPLEPPALKWFTAEDLLDSTLLILSAAYNEKDFFQVTYVVHHAYGGEWPAAWEKAVALKEHIDKYGEDASELRVEDDQQDAKLDAKLGEDVGSVDEQGAGAVGSVGLLEKYQELLAACKVSDLDVNQLRREVRTDQPRVRRFKVDWKVSCASFDDGEEEEEVVESDEKVVQGEGESKRDTELMSGQKRTREVSNDASKDAVPPVKRVDVGDKQDVVSGSHHVGGGVVKLV